MKRVLDILLVILVVLVVVATATAIYHMIDSATYQ